MSPDVIVPVIALLLPVGLVFVHKYFRYKEKVLELQARGGSPPLLTAGAVPTDKRLLELEERVQNLESIIVAMDGELGALPGRPSRDELRQLTAKAGASAAPALPAASPPARLGAPKTETPE